MKIILNILVTILVILFCMPVILLPLTTSVPAWTWILLAIADVIFSPLTLHRPQNSFEKIISIFKIPTLSAKK